MVDAVSGNYTNTVSAAYSSAGSSTEVDNAVPGDFSISEDGNVVFTLTENESDEPESSLADAIRESASDILKGSPTLGGVLIKLYSADYTLLEQDLSFIDTVTKNGAPLFQELENLEAILLSAPTSGEMDALVNFNGGQHAARALNYLTEFINFSNTSGVSNEHLNSDIYNDAKIAINKISNGEAPTEEEASALRAIVSAAKVPMEQYSYGNLATLLQSNAHDTQRIQNNFSKVSN